MCTYLIKGNGIFSFLLYSSLKGKLHTHTHTHTTRALICVVCFPPHEVCTYVCKTKHRHINTDVNVYPLSPLSTRASVFTIILLLRFKWDGTDLSPGFE